MNDLDEERKYLEGLLNTRFNFYLVFNSLLLVAAYSTDKQVHTFLLLVLGLCVSVFFTTATIRTYHFVSHVSNRIIDEQATHPYAKACEDDPPFWDANLNFAVIIPCAIVLGYIALIVTNC